MLRAADAAQLIRDGFAEYHASFRASSRRSAQHFAARDWQATRREASARLALYREHIDAVLAALASGFRTRLDDATAWTAVRDAYAGLVEGREDAELAETFFNSITRRMLTTIGVDAAVEFVRDADLALRAPDGIARRIERPGNSHALARAILACSPHTHADPERDARNIAGAIEHAVRAEWRADAPDGADVLPYLFYRNKGAYLVGRLRHDRKVMPLVIALLNDARGIYADAVVTSADEASIVFGFSWSYFHADIPRPAEAVSFLASIMPQKRVDELYTAIGYNKHGKSELYRELVEHLRMPDARFEEAEGTKGLVMSVFTLPSLNIVFKVIRESIGYPKRTTRREVMEKYQFVFDRDRVGRLADAQEFEHLELPLGCFSPELLAELEHAAPNIARVHGDRVVVSHLYTQRRLRPLNLHARESEADAAAAAVVDYGNAIRDLAAADIFTGDMLLKNFGVSRHGRVIFYDYDELATITECQFRDIPSPAHLGDELSADPWFSVGEHDVFPEEFRPFLVPGGALGEVFLAAHGDLLDPEWWRDIQRRLEEGEMFDTFPYPASRRFRRD